MLRRYIAIIIALAVLISVAGCAPKEKEEIPEESPIQEEANLRNTLVYYLDDIGYLVPVMRQLPWQEDMAMAALMTMISSPENDADAAKYGLKTVLPQDSKIEMQMDKGVARLTFAKDDLKAEDAASEKARIAAIVNTLTAFDTIDSVMLQTEDKQKKLQFGTALNKKMKATALNIESLGQNDKKPVGKVSLYFENNSLIVPVTRYIDAEADLKRAIEELMKGPKKGCGLKCSMPPDTKLLDVKLDPNGFAILNFSKEFSKLTDNPEAEKAVLKTLLLTCLQFDNVKDIQILVEGQNYSPSDAATFAAPVFANQY